jgi:hypothetical protein
MPQTHALCAQAWTAFGIMLGYVASIAFYFVPDQGGIVGLRWRLMLGSAAIPPLFVISLIFFSPESPRWYMSKGRKADAYYAMRRIRNTPLEAARDLYFASELLQAEREVSGLPNLIAPRSVGLHVARDCFCGSAALLLTRPSRGARRSCTGRSRVSDSSSSSPLLATAWPLRAAAGRC